VDGRTVIRERYIRKLMDLVSDSRIKVIYGPSYVGKTTLLRQFKNELIRSGVSDDSIVSISFDRGFNLVESADAYLYLLNNSCKPEKKFMFIDSAEMSPGYSEVLSSFHRKHPGVNMIVTVCSNSPMITSAPLWEMTDCAVGVPLYPFTFREFMMLYPGDRNRSLSEFMALGGLPIMYRDFSADDLQVATQCYTHLILNNLNMRESKINPVAMGELLFYIVANMNRPLTMKELIEHSSIVDNRTLEKYLDRFVSSNILYRCDGYQADRGMKPSAKSVFFPVDTLSGQLFTSKGVQSARSVTILYNIVFIELKARGYEPKALIAKGEVLGLCISVNGNSTLIRVAESLDLDRSSATFSTYRSAVMKKMLLTLDSTRQDYNRYNQRNVAEFLLSDDI